MSSRARGRPSKLAGHSIEEKPTMNGASTFSVATNASATRMKIAASWNSALQPETLVGGRSSATPLLSGFIRRQTGSALQPADLDYRVAEPIYSGS